MSEDKKRYWEQIVETVDRESINSIIKTVAFEFKWAPNTISNFYLDDFDSQGLLFWYNEILIQITNKD